MRMILYRKKIVNTNVIPKLIRSREGSTYRERTKRRDIKKPRSLHGLLGASFRRQPCKCNEHVIPRVHGTSVAQEVHSKDLGRGEGGREMYYGRVPCAEVN